MEISVFETLQKSPLSSQELENKVMKFESLGSLVVQTGRAQKYAIIQVVSDVELQTVEDSTFCFMGSTSIQHIVKLNFYTNLSRLPPPVPWFVKFFNRCYATFLIKYCFVQMNFTS